MQLLHCCIAYFFIETFSNETLVSFVHKSDENLEGFVEKRAGAQSSTEETYRVVTIKEFLYFTDHNRKGGVPEAVYKYFDYFENDVSRNKHDL